jgi:hypothetical protein
VFQGKTLLLKYNYTGPGSNYISIANVGNISIFTEHTSAWTALMEDLLGENVTITKKPTYVEIRKIDGHPINFYHREFYIYAQISPGWIK